MIDNELKATHFTDTIGDYHCQIPLRFGKYEYVKTLGKGSFSVVILVTYLPNKTLHACKVVNREVLAKLDIFPRFEQEVRLMQTLNNPYVVSLEDVVFEKDFIFLIMEYCSNGDLFKRIVTYGPYEDPELRSIFRKIVEGMQYIHSKNIAHRDLKPENILLDSQLNPKIADFGLCHETATQKLLMTPCGSPFYAPPEIISNDAYDGKLSDVWSLGVVLYTMATGTLPWTEVNQTKLFIQIENADFSIPTNLSPPVQQMLHEMMSRLPSNRPTIEQVLENPWLSSDDELMFLRPTSLNSRKKKNYGTLSSAFESNVAKNKNANNYSAQSTNDAGFATRSISGKRPIIIRPEMMKKNTSSMKVTKIGPLDCLIRKVPPKIKKAPF